MKPARSVVDYPASRPDVDPARIGALGVSLGASPSILAAGRDPRIKPVVADGPFANMASAIHSGYSHFIGLPAFPFAPLTVFVAELRTVQRVAIRAPLCPAPGTSAASSPSSASTTDAEGRGARGERRTARLRR